MVTLKQMLGFWYKHVPKPKIHHLVDNQVITQVIPLPPSFREADPKVPDSDAPSAPPDGPGLGRKWTVSDGFGTVLDGLGRIRTESDGFGTEAST